jgi:hypothetical protein
MTLLKCALNISVREGKHIEMKVVWGITQTVGWSLLWPVRFQCVRVWILTGVPCINKHIWLNVYLFPTGPGPSGMHKSGCVSVWHLRCVVFLLCMAHAWCLHVCLCILIWELMWCVSFCNFKHSTSGKRNKAAHDLHYLPAVSVSLPYNELCINFSSSLSFLNVLLLCGTRLALSV